MAETVESKDRIIQPTFDKKGGVSYASTTSPPSDSFAVCYMVPDRVIPVIFVPGVMGSNLANVPKPGEEIETVWVLDSSIGMGYDWGTVKAPKRKELLRPEVTQVYSLGKIAQGTAQTDAELLRRGWGEVGYTSYAEGLVWLENHLNDFSNPQSGDRVATINAVLEGAIKADKITRDEVALTYKYQFPVHAVGYNWLDSNAKSAERLARKIKEFVAFYANNKIKCEKVIVVTHSMGGLVARHCSENLGMKDTILGIVHGVMPAIGAAAVYRRMKAGTENPNKGKGTLKSTLGGAASEVLGGDAAEMTTVLSSAPGPLQLLPSIEYGMQWLKFNDGGKDMPELSLPKADPYSEIYTVRGKWWSLCDDWLIDARDKPKEKTAEKLDKDWKGFKKLVNEKVKDFLEIDIKGKYHANTYAFIGLDNSHKAYGQVTWTFKQAFNYVKPTSANLLDAPFRRTSGEGIEHPTSKVETKSLGKTQMEDRIMPMEVSNGEEAGDGTVPSRSGRAVKSHAKSYFELARVEHEPAYKNGNHHAQLAALHGILKIAQGIKDVPKMAYK